MVLRDRPVRRAISRIDSFSRNAMRRMMFKSPMWITPVPPAALRFGEGSHGSILSGNYAPTRVSSQVEINRQGAGHRRGMPIDLRFRSTRLHVPGPLLCDQVWSDEGAAALHLVERSFVPEPRISAATLYERFGADTLDRVARRILETHDEAVSSCPISAHIAE